MSKAFFEFSQEIFAIEDVSCLCVTRDSGYSIEKSRRKSNAFVYVQKGSMRYVFEGGKTVEIREGGMLFVPEETSYRSTYKEDNTTIKIVQFDLGFGMLPDKFKKPLVINEGDLRQWIEGFFDFKTNKLYHVYKIYEIILQITDENKNSEPKFQKLEPALEHMRKNYGQSLKVEDYALLCRMSQSHFRRTFLELTGFSPIEYRNRIRLSEAKKLIESGEYNVEEAARETGFFNISFFCRSFKKVYGKTPSGK